MLKSLLDWFKGQFTLSQEVAQLRREHNELERKVDQQIELLREVIFTLEHDRKMRGQEHANLLLKLENELLKFERRLPPSRPDDDTPKLSD